MSPGQASRWDATSRIFPSGSLLGESARVMPSAEEILLSSQSNSRPSESRDKIEPDEAMGRVYGGRIAAQGDATKQAHTTRKDAAVSFFPAHGLRPTA